MQRRVSAVASLLQQAATRLCPPASAAASDAALTLLSALRAAQLQLPGSGGEADDAATSGGAAAAAFLQGSMQSLLQALQPSHWPACVQPDSSVDGAAAAAASRRSAGLAALAKRLGYRPCDLHAAQAGLVRRTALALLRPADGSASCEPPSSPLPPSPQQQHQEAEQLLLPATVAELDCVLQATVHAPPLLGYDSGDSSDRGELQRAVRELLWVLRRYPPAAHRCQLSPPGWAAYWMLEPRVGGCAGR